MELLLFLGHDSLDKEFAGYTVRADKLFIHPNYFWATARKTGGWDYCLIRLSKDLKFDCKVKSIGFVPKVFKYYLKNDYK